MITIFNRKELAATFDMQLQAQMRKKLAAAKIDYTVKTINRRSASPMAAGTRAATGSAGERAEMEREYIIYVRRCDYDAAKKCVN